MRKPSVTGWSALAVWAVAAACAAFWASRVFVQPAPLPPGTSTVPTTQALRGDITRLLGEPLADEDVADAAPVVAEASRFRLLGVVAPKAPAAAREGVALIAVDGKPARAFRVGAEVDGTLVLQRVHVRGADLGARDAAQASVSLSVAPLPPPATGVPGARPPGAAPTFAPPRPLPLAPRPLPGAQRVQPGGDPTGEPDEGDMADGDTGMDGEVEMPAPARPGIVAQ
jgi:general secretion pathway protein C